MGATNPASRCSGAPDALIDHDRTLIVEAARAVARPRLWRSRGDDADDWRAAKGHRRHHLYGSRGKRAA